ncbi:hypothetical protein MHB44_09725 [Lysinibacillus sp. FSL H8-0500]|uniref:hypothetical protein n=1 Tax=Lysinibacillus sp. FSL H8-0500 TaxID=2921393 RepID=UPI0031017AFA
MNNLPLGYKRDKDGNIVIDEQNVKHIQKVFDIAEKVNNIELAAYHDARYLNKYVPKTQDK